MVFLVFLFFTETMCLWLLVLRTLYKLVYSTNSRPHVPFTHCVCFRVLYISTTSTVGSHGYTHNNTPCYQQKLFKINIFLQLTCMFYILSPRAHLGSRENVGFCPIDSNRNFSTRGAEFLEQSAICANPKILLCDFHLERKIKTLLVRQKWR